MSGYLERLVGRHVEPPVVRPRAVSRFEGDIIGGSVQMDATMLESRPAPERVASVPPAALPTRTAERSAARVGSPPVDQPNGRTARDRTDAPPPAAIESPSGSSAAGQPADAAPGGRTDRAADGRQRDEPARAVTHDPPVIVPAVLRIAPADPVVAALPVAVVQARRPAAPAAHEPDVVHVHIGRVEVRAEAPAREPSRPAPRAARPAPLSLDRYLAGERRT